MSGTSGSFGITLISPPLWGSLHGPALALPSLAGTLMECGFNVRQRDLNIETIVNTYLGIRDNRNDSFLDVVRRLGHHPFKEALYAAA